MRILPALFLCTLLTVSVFSTAQVFKIDNGHTSVTSKVMRFEVVKVLGRFNSVSGTVNYNAADVTKTTADIKILSDSYSANNAEGENAIKSPVFLDSKKYPEINIIVKSLSKNAAGFDVKADLTLHGITKEISFPVMMTGPSMDLPTQKQSIGIMGKVVINRQDFDIKMAAKMPSGGMVVGNEVEIEINALAIAQ
ncbi:MAG TPA: YceI family protein [Cyclobacteriaceae bacterium]|nr:YceI family protein [Cyclobacteriaceae bacterium]HMV10222.1 YceI family protein [Cyclobacteriaceae bacterium]HMV89756.1 YceI family protein [Cyclobacteriaceae bacterium]HMX01559.1 YceI family protein [Cyclobacteriaceae bacterium]HMX51440.1 YceI family protein [Cyclobacteriaceae bacterium]